MAMKKQLQGFMGCLMITAATVMVATISARAQQSRFQIEEASIADIQNAIRAGQTTCRGVVQAYLDRAKAYNGVCTAILTKDGAPIPPATGMMRAGSLLKYPTQTVPASTVFPNLDQYTGLPLELGKMITSISDPSVQLQYGWRVGIPEAGQLNALETQDHNDPRWLSFSRTVDKALVVLRGDRLVLGRHAIGMGLEVLEKA